jgi:SAM-dependent methyltransferase
MTNAADHYEQLLADHYSWMFGASTVFKAAEQREILTRFSVAGGDLALDLGAGSGFQSIALADLGFKRVMAIDTSAKLLQELQHHRGNRPIELVHDDMMHLAQHSAPGTADAVVCMGDTLPHLSAREQVTRLFSEVARVLRPEGQFVLSFRDLSAQIGGVDRFIPVRSTADKIMTCFLEYGPDTVMVHDLIHVRDGDSWKLLKSCYPKLRLSADEVRRGLEAVGFEVYGQDTVRGMSVLAARRS